jgi:hypothetical protein
MFGTLDSAGNVSNSLADDPGGRQ